MNLRQTRKKIRSVTNVKKITKAMQMISAIKMKKSQAAALEGRPYDEALKKLIDKVMPRVSPKFSALLTPKDKTAKRNLAIIISSNKGLCGGFNVNLFRFISHNLDFHDTDLVIVGKKATYLGRLGGNIVADFSSLNPVNNISAIFSFSLDKFLKENYKEINLFYNKFVSVLKSEPTKVKILPVKIEEKVEKKEGAELEPEEYLIEPHPKHIIDKLLRSYVEESIKNAVLESEASEHSSRMISMKNATDNATDVIYNLTLLRNKIRQQNITNELLDMVSAKESVGEN